MSILDYAFNIDRSSTTPIWLQIKQHLLHCIYQGDLKAGQLIPNEQNLVKLFNVSVGTVRKSIAELEREGMLITKQGSGTLVASHDAQRFLYKYFHIKAKNSAEKSLPHIITLSFRKCKVSAFEAKQLNITAQEPVYEIYNLLSIDKASKTNMLDKIILPSYAFSGLSKEIFISRKSTIYNLYQNRFSIFVTKINERIEAVSATKAIAEKMNIVTKQPLLKITRTAYTYDDKPVELRISYILTNTVEYCITHK